jgi:hypothetical protein
MITSTASNEPEASKVFSFLQPTANNINPKYTAILNIRFIVEILYL